MTTYYGTSGDDTVSLGNAYATHVYTGLAGEDAITIGFDWEDEEDEATVYGGNDFDSISGTLDESAVAHLYAEFVDVTGDQSSTTYIHAEGTLIFADFHGTGEGYIYGGDTSQSDDMIWFGWGNYLASNAPTGGVYAGDGDDVIWSAPFSGGSTVTLDGGEGENFFIIDKVNTSGDGNYSINATNPHDGSGTDHYYVNFHLLEERHYTITDYGGLEDYLYIGVDNNSGVTSIGPSDLNYDHDALDLVISYEDSSVTITNYFGSGCEDIETHFIEHIYVGDAELSYITEMNNAKSDYLSWGMAGLDPSAAHGDLHDHIVSEFDDLLIDMDSAATEAFWPNDIEGTSGSETISGTTAWDRIVAYEGNDVVYGDEGDDFIFGGSGNDTLHGEEGHDYITDCSGADTVYGGTGNDEIHTGEGGADVIYGQEGDDLIYGGNDGNTIYSDDVSSTYTGHDEIHGGTSVDYIYGGYGDDDLNGSYGDDTVYGGDGADEIDGSYHNDVLYGDAGNDTIEGNWGTDEIHGGDGDDELYGHLDNNETGTDTDTIYGDGGNDKIGGGNGDDFLYGGEVDPIRGTAVTLG